MDIFKAIRTGNLSSLIAYIRGGGDIEARDFYNMTPLIAAAGEDRTDMAGLIIKAGADIDAKDKIGQTALHLAAGRNNTDIIKMLIEAKADLNLKALNGLTAYQYAAENGMKESADLIRRFLKQLKK
jgi:ankyrin repeat protein